MRGVCVLLHSQNCRMTWGNHSAHLTGTANIKHGTPSSQ